MSQAITSVNVNESNSTRLCHTIVKSVTSYFVWKISNFSQYIAKVGSFMKSSKFIFKVGNITTEWELKLYPFGVDEKIVENHFLSIFIYRLDNGPEMRVRYKLYLLDANEDEEEVIKDENIFSYMYSKYWGCPKFLKRNSILERKSKLLPNDQLTICFDLTALNDISTTCTYEPSGPSDIQVLQNLAKDLNSLLDSKKLTDISIVVGERKFPAHKLILAARSPVFASMFENDMTESTENVVEIDDIESEIFEKLLHYIYTGIKPDMKNVETTEAILYAADKYFLGDLKKMCEVALREMVTTENAVDLLVLADKFGLNFLNDSVTEFVILNMHDVIETPKWDFLKEEHPKVACEVLQKATKKMLVK